LEVIPNARRSVPLRRIKSKAPALQQEQTEQNGMNVSIKLKNRNEFIGKSGDLQNDEQKKVKEYEYRIEK